MTNQSVLAAPDAVASVTPAVTQLEMETPSWGYGNSGTRFKVFPQPGVPRNPFEKIEDAAIVGRFTGVAQLDRAAHPVGPCRRFLDAGGVCPRARGAHWRHQLQYLPG